jgi:hypothetical protein
LTKIGGADDFELMGKKALLNEHDGVLSSIECHRAEVARAAADGDVHAEKLNDLNGLKKLNEGALNLKSWNR